MKIVHCKKEKYTVYIGRPSAFGNPFAVGRDGSREEVIAKYETLARSSPDLMEAIGNLKEDDVLGCWCFPQRCHGEVIIKLWKEIHGVQNEVS
jgi:hypothetical protein